MNSIKELALKDFLLDEEIFDKIQSIEKVDDNTFKVNNSDIFLVLDSDERYDYLYDKFEKLIEEDKIKLKDLNWSIKFDDYGKEYFVVNWVLNNKDIEKILTNKKLPSNIAIYNDKIFYIYKL